MKIFFYGVSNYHLPYIKEWIQKNNVQVDYTFNSISKRNIALSAGYDSICFFPSKEMRLDEEWFYQRLSENGIKHLSLKSTGVDCLNFSLIKKYNFTVANVPSYSPTSVGHFAIMSILMLLRRIPNIANDLKKKMDTWENELISDEISEKTIGILGTGRIGRVVAEGIFNLGGNVIVTSHHEDEKLRDKVKYVSFTELLRKADVISIHIPLTSENEHLLSDQEFEKMKQGVFLVNTARGKLIDTQAMINALKNGKVAGAAIDTLEDEELYPGESWFENPYYKKLNSFDNVFVTPHIAFFTQKAIKEITNTALENAKNMAEEKRNSNIIEM